MSLLKELINFHKHNYVLADIRASNIVFGKDTDWFGEFLDLDFCGKVGDVYYPETFRLEISDGRRAPEVQPGSEAKQEHDCFSLAKTLKLFELKDQTMKSGWDKVLNEILNNKLGNALQLLDSMAPFEFIEH